MDRGLAPSILLLAFACLGLGFVVALSGRRKRLEERAAATTGPAMWEDPWMSRAVGPTGGRRTVDGGWLNRILTVRADLPRAYLVSPVWVLLTATVLALCAIWASHAIVPWRWGIAVALVVWIVAARTIFRWAASRYRSRLSRQLPEAIRLVADAARMGLSAAEWFPIVEHEMPNPTKAAFALVVDEIAFGEAPDQALLLLYHQTGLTEYALLAMAIRARAQEGGTGTETIAGLAETIRDRGDFAAAVGAAAARTRIAAISATLLLTTALLAVAALKQGFLEHLIAGPHGRQILTAGAIALALDVPIFYRAIRGARST